MSLKAQRPVIREQRGSKKAKAPEPQVVVPSESPQAPIKSVFTLVQKKHSLLRKRG